VSAALWVGIFNEEGLARLLMVISHDEGERVSSLKEWTSSSPGASTDSAR
jgi:hypothetical protein